MNWIWVSTSVKATQDMPRSINGPDDISTLRNWVTFQLGVYTLCAFLLTSSIGPINLRLFLRNFGFLLGLDRGIELPGQIPKLTTETT